ncbi:MAG: SAM-dependent methyltransferase, partial [Christensenellales bacterium]
CCYVQTAQHPAVESVKELGVEYQSLDALYEQAEDFDGLNKAMAEKVLEQADKKRVLFAVTGEASQGQSAVQAVMHLAEEKKMTVKILPGIGVAAAAMAEAGLCSENGIQTQYGAVDLLRVDCDKRR